MESNDSRPTRRSVLKATGAAIGAVGLTAATEPATAERLCLASTQNVFEDCPPTGFGPEVQEGSEAFAHMGCEANGTQYYYVSDHDAEGYVTRWFLEPC